ncbi:Hypothetical predicted protein [Paramuricea clavata]|uniref:Uncharacterized protein n=2 Tax=Paramuricea clavata TaxID=317549 RepID=A0A6S7K9U3_PARCT|nr:Hypothetical predicted protein [Paramuricea clavata]
MPATEIEPSPFVVRATGGGTANQRRPSTKPSSLQRATSPTNEYLSSDSDSSSTSDSDILPSGKKDSYTNKGGVRFEDVFSNMKDYYGVKILEPNKTSREKYQSFVAIERNANNPAGGTIDVLWEERDKKETTQKFDHSWKPSKLTVSCALMYEIYVDNSWTGDYTISSFSMAKYKSFFSSYSTA